MLQVSLAVNIHHQKKPGQAYQKRDQDIGKYLVSILAESKGIKVVDNMKLVDVTKLKKYIGEEKPIIFGLSGKPSSLLAETYRYNEIINDPNYKDRASFMVFSPPVTLIHVDRMRVDIYSDFSNKKIKDFIEILKRSFTMV